MDKVDCRQLANYFIASQSQSKFIFDLINQSFINIIHFQFYRIPKTIDDKYIYLLYDKIRIKPVNCTCIYTNEFDISKSLTYRGLMLSGLPNCIFFAGYTNASWTLKSDLTSEYASRLLKFMDQKNYKYMVPKVIDEDLETIPLLNLNSGYIHRSENEFPRQGSKLPWRLYQNYFRDYKTLRINKLTDKELQFK